MSRNNEDRIGIKDRNAGAEAPITTNPIPPQIQEPPQQPASPLSFVAPTEFVVLPSEGKYYPQGHPLYGQKTIEIKHMTTKEEDILTSQSLLKTGKALDRFIEEVIVDKRINPNSLLVGDKNAILISARISGYGEDYTTQVLCPSCQSQSSYEFNLRSVNVSHGGVEQNSEFVSETGGGTFLVDSLPVTNWLVEVKPLTGEDEAKLIASIEVRKKHKLSEDVLTKQITSFIVSIDGVTDRAQISHAVSQMPARDSRFLRTIYNEVIPNIDLKQNFTCSECGFSGDTEVPFTTDFFWPKQ